MAGVLLVAATSCAPAFDCKKAATPSEKAICADPAALAADAAMSSAFSSLLASAPAAQHGPIAAAQVKWLHARDSECADSAAGTLGACLARQSTQRLSFLLGQPEAGPGAASRITPWFRFEKGGKGRAAIDIELLKFPDPTDAAERAFNAAADKLVGDLDQPEKDDPSADRFDYERSMRLTYASPRFVSAHLDAYQDVGGAHPATFTGNVNVDFAAGREARFDDLVDARGAEKIFSICMRSVAAQKKDKMGADAPKSADDLAELVKNVKDATRNLAAWSFGADKATIGYDPYAVGSYAEGPYDCEIPYATLRELAKPGFPLP